MPLTFFHKSLTGTLLKKGQSQRRVWNWYLDLDFENCILKFRKVEIVLNFAAAAMFLSLYEFHDS